MAKMIEIHMIQSIPCNNINRGSDGEVKNIMFGGTLRQRVSSQAWKRPVRLSVQDEFSNKGTVSRSFGDNILEELKSEGVDSKILEKMAKTLGIPVKVEKKAKKNSDEETSDSRVMMYLSTEEVEAIKNFARTGEDKKFVDVIKDAGARISSDISLFGRMFADNPILNVYGAVKMSHAISTHEIYQEDDYFTAIDQLDTNGAGHVANQSFTSSTMYRYIAIDVDQLEKNLQGESVEDVLKIALKEFVLAFPKGKENSMMAMTRPDFINFVVRNNKNACNMSNAFEKAVVSSENGFSKPSIDALKKYRDNMFEMYADEVLVNVEVSKESPLNTSISAVISSLVG